MLTTPSEWVLIKAATGFSQISTADKKVKTKDCVEVGKFPVIDQGQSAVAGYIDDPDKLVVVSEPIIVFGDHTRAIKWVDFDFVPGADGTKVLQPEPYLLPRFAYFQMRALEIPDKGYSRHFKFLKELNFSVPPLAEQKVIADKLDTLLAQADSIKARLERIPELLKRFRQSVLAAAVNGRLTEEWRVDRSLDFNSWENTTFADICREITVGYVGKMGDRYEEYGIPFLRSQNVRAFHFSPVNLLYISEEFHQEIYKSRLEQGDLAIVRSGAPGTTCVIPGSLGIANCSDLVIARPADKLISEFGCIFMNSEVAKKNVLENRVGVAQQHFNVGSMKKMPIHLPSIEEQTEIVRRVDQLFAYADTVERQVNSALERVNQLTQSILAKAFRGELTTQWRADNPELISGENSAEALLERIKAERAAQAPKKRTRKKAKA
ncbi:hypothetical protein B4O83_00035 [Chromohalobacter israelensis]|nr:hypothetical protein B4O83_00035 [Chromohalobacter salexigens]